MENKIIITALRDEASPIIDFYNLSRDTKQSDLKVYANNKYSLLITGVGRKKVSDTLPIYLKRIYNPNSILINGGAVVFSEMVGLSPETNYYSCGDAKCVGINYNLYDKLIP